VYHTWTIDHQVTRYIGTRDKHEVTLKTASDEVYIKKTTIYNTQNPSQEAIAQGTLNLSNNYYDVNWPRGCWETNVCWSSFKTYGVRMWPDNVYTYNKKIDSKNITQITNNKDDSKSYKDYWWVVVLLALGTFFLYTTTVKKPKINLIKKKKSKLKGRIAKYWAGEESLAFSFWGVSTIGVIVFQIPNYILIGMGDAYFDNLSVISLLIYVLYVFSLIIYLVIAYVGCWRSAARYIKENLKKKKSAFWGYTSYFLIVLSVIRMFGQLLSEIV
jgi:hypothetical protein